MKLVLPELQCRKIVVCHYSAALCDIGWPGTLLTGLMLEYIYCGKYLLTTNGLSP